MPNKLLQVRVNEKVLDTLGKHARAERRTLNEVVRMSLEDTVAALQKKRKPARAAAFDIDPATPQGRAFAKAVARYLKQK